MGNRPFTLQQVLSAPYATSLTAAPTGNLFAWVENAEGRHNLYIGAANLPARQLTHNTADDAQDITQLAWAPDASAIAYTYGAETGADGHPANPAHLQHPTPVGIVVQPIAPGAAPVFIGEGRAPLFTPDNSPIQHSLLFLRAGQIWITDLASPKPQQLVFDRGYASSLTLSPDGNLLAFVSHRREDNEPSHSFLALFDLKAHTLHFLNPTTSDDSAPVFSPDGKQIAWLRAPFTQAPEFATNRTSPNPWSIELADLATGATRTIFSPEPNQPGSVLPHLSEGAPHLFFSADNTLDFYSEADGWVHLYEIPTAGDPETAWMTPGQSEAEDVIFSPDHRTLVYASNQARGNPADADRRHLWRLDLTQTDTPPVPLTHGDGIETHPVFAADGTLAALVSDATTPVHPAIIHPDGHITPLHPDAIPADYPATALVTPQQVLFDTGDGQHLHGQLFLPHGAEHSTIKRPTIVFLHGGPHRQMLLGYPASDYYSNAYAMNQYLVSRGFIVLSVNYRCGIGYGLNFRECEHAGATGATEYNDVLATAAYLRTRDDVDPARIGVWGGSYGGYLTALALARNSDIFAAGVDFHGVHDWNLEDNAGDWKQGTNAERDAIGAKALASSPFADIDHWRSPVLLIHGDNDPEVAYAQTPLLAEALRARHVPVQELIFPDELHGFLLHRDWLAAYQAAADFFERTLKPPEAGLSQSRLAPTALPSAPTPLRASGPPSSHRPSS
jgi:dipeptidyl aminopeptidase/acylaminoacyl peptidase